MLHHLHSTEPAPHTEGRTIRWAGWYDASVTLLSLGQAPAIRALTMQQARIQPGDRVLDVGCGTGDLSLRAKERAGATGEVYGVDAAPEMIDVARRKAAHKGAVADFRVGLIEALPFQDNYFDIALSSLMMHHLPEAVKAQGLAEVYRVLKPGGRLLILDIQRPTSAAGRAMMTLLMHGGLQVGVQDLAPKLQAAGFSAITTSDAKFGILGFVQAQKG